MNQISGGVSVLCQTPFAQRVSSDISVADFSPRTSVAFVAVVAAREVIVVCVHQPLMFFAVHAVCQFGTSRVTARSLRSSGHGAHLFSFFADYIIPQRGYCKIVDFTVNFRGLRLHAAPCGAFCRCCQCRNPSARLSAPKS